MVFAARAVIAGLAALVTGLTAFAAPAYADPTPQEIEAQIDAAWRDLEPVIEEHNATRIELAARQDEAAELEQLIEPLQLQVDLAMAEVADYAVHAYKGGTVSAVNALLSSGSPYLLAEQLTRLDQVARARHEQLTQVIETKAEFEAEKAELDAMVVELAALEEDLAERAAGIDAEIDALQELRIEVYGNGGGIGDLRPAPCPTTYPGGAAGDAITFACNQIGKPYVWGSAGPDSYDCSGLTLSAWAQAGINLPHNAAQQRNVVRNVDRSELRPGDLVFYNGLSHVAMYAGDGWIVHAPQAGEPVRMSPMDRMTIHSYGRPG